jgi:hypothetical protein
MLRRVWYSEEEADAEGKERGTTLSRFSPLERKQKEEHERIQSLQNQRKKK